MSDDFQAPGSGAKYTYDEPNAILQFLRQPRILLLLLAAWSIIGVLAEAFTNNGFFSDLDKQDIDGLLGGLALGWEGVPLTALYIYCFRNPTRYPRIFWLALIHMGSLSLSLLYHLVTGDVPIASIIVPAGVTGGLLALVFIHLFGNEDEEEEEPRRAT